MKRVRTLIVDDSATGRAMITAALTGDPEIEIVGHAADAFDALRAIKSLEPDVLTLDIEMPRLSGRDFLKTIMRIRPMPIIMVSAHTTANAPATKDALYLGARDWATMSHNLETLPGKIKAAARAQTRKASTRFEWNGKLVVLGASAGGVEGLMEIVSRFPDNCPPTLIVQHIPQSFVRGLIQRMNRHSSARASEAVDGMPLEPGNVYIAPGSRHLQVAGARGDWQCQVRHGQAVQGFMPSIDLLFRSAAQNAGSRAVGALLSGLGRDGVDGLLELRRAGGQTFAQEPSTCMAYALPKAAIDAGAVERRASCAVLATELLEHCNATKTEHFHV
jgi:two-component system chemotaxis response regulator CheB